MPAYDADDKGIYLGAAFAFVFDREGRFLLLEERPDSRKYMYDLPGGTLRPAEHPVTGLQREVSEETGLVIELTSPLCYLKQDTHDSGYAILVGFYIARVIGSEVVQMSVEHSAYRWVTPEEYRKEGLELSLANDHVESLLLLYEQGL